MSKVVKAVGNAISGAVKAVVGVVKAVVNVATSLVNMVISPFMGAFDVPTDVPGQSESIKGVQGTKTGSNIPIPIIYGYREVGGNIVFCETGSTNNKYLWVAYVICEGPIHQIQTLTINDIQLGSGVVNALNGGGVVAVNDGSKLAGRTSLQLFKGAYYSNPASTGVGTAIKADLFSESPSFSTSMNFNGLCVLFARYEWKEAATQAEADNNPFSGTIPTIKIGVQGRTVASLTLSGFDANNVPTGTNNAQNYTYGGSGYTEQWSLNPAECLLDYLRNPRYGKGLVNDDIDWNAFYIAAHKCRTTVDYITGVQGPALTLNYVVNTSTSIFNNVKLLLQQFRGYLPYNRGKFSLRIEDAGHPTDITSGVATISKTFTKDNIFGDISYTGIDKTNKYNQVIVKYVDPDNKWSEQQVVYPATETERLSYIAADGGRENKGEFTFAGITNYSIAYNFARLIFYKSRFQDSLEFKAGSEAFDLEPGDNIYLDGNILKFGTDPAQDAIPWRIVTIQMNSDYTYDISCVRNQDSIYPHTRAGERDYHIGIYIPDGANRKYPVEPVGVPVGLNPPGINDLPDPTNPNFKLEHYITISQSTYIVEDGQTYAIIEFYQPETPQYFATHMWWKITNANVLVWNKVIISDRLESGALLRTKIGPLVTYGNYELRTRVQYTNGDMSTALAKATLVVEPNGSEDPKDYSEFIDGGWKLITTAPLNPRNTRVEYIKAQTQVDGSGHPLSLKKIKFTGKEYYSNILNPNVVGMRVNWKQSSATYWKQKDVRFLPTYRDAGGYFEFEIDDLGISSYPTLPGVEQYYDFIFKYIYDDNSMSTVQLTARNIPTEINDNSQYNYDAFAPYANVTYTDSSVGKAIQTEDMAPPGAVVDVRDIRVGLKDVYATPYGLNNCYLSYEVNLPDASNRINLYGVRVYYRPVIQAQNPAYVVKDFFPLPVIKGYVNQGLITLSLQQGVKYEIIIVCVVNYLGTKTEARQSWFTISTPKMSGASQDLRVSLLTDYKLLDTPEAKKELLITFPITDPTPNVISWSRKHTDLYWGNYDRLGYWYYQLRVQVPTTGFQELQIYRRSRYDQAGTTAAKYYGTGRWEKIIVTTSTHTFDANGQATINLRPPVQYTEYDQYYEKGSNTLIDPQWGDALTPLLKPLNTESSFPQHEFFLVLKVSGVESIVGVLLPRYNFSAIYNPLNPRPETEDILGGQVPPKVLTADYEAYDAGYSRRLSEYRLRLNDNQLCLYSYRNGAQLYVPPTATPVVK
jgi:hypothetical protein